MLAPERTWWKPMGRMEKTWLTVAFVWCIFLTIMMPLWYYMGKQNVPTETYKTTPQQYAAKVNEFVAKYQVGEENGVEIGAGTARRQQAPHDGRTCQAAMAGNIDPRVRAHPHSL